MKHCLPFWYPNPLNICHPAPFLIHIPQIEKHPWTNDTGKSNSKPDTCLYGNWGHHRNKECIQNIYQSYSADKSSSDSREYYGDTVTEGDAYSHERANAGIPD